MPWRLSSSKLSKPEMKPKDMLADWMLGFSAHIIQRQLLSQGKRRSAGGRIEVISPVFERLYTNDKMELKSSPVGGRVSFVNVGPSVRYEQTSFVAFPWLQMCQWFCAQHPGAKEFFDTFIVDTHARHKLPSRVSKHLMLTDEKRQQRDDSIRESMKAFFEKSGAITATTTWLGLFFMPGPRLAPLEAKWEDLQSQMLGFFDAFVAPASDGESDSDVGFIKALLAEYGQQASSQEAAQEAAQEQRSAVKY